jgi:Cu2+-containing amine oxidase
MGNTEYEPLAQRYHIPFVVTGFEPLDILQGVYMVVKQLEEGRAEVELVVRMIAQVGNYDYMIDWVFNQGGAIRVEVSLTGIDAAKAVRSTNLADASAAADTQHGTLVAPNLAATFHSHHFNFRLDLDIDGPNNSFALGEFKVVNNNGARKSFWVPEEKVLASERDGKINGGDIWRVFNPAKKMPVERSFVDSSTHCPISSS